MAAETVRLSHAQSLRGVILTYFEIEGRKESNIAYNSSTPMLETKSGIFIFIIRHRLLRKELE